MVKKNKYSQNDVHKYSDLLNLVTILEILD